MKNHHHFTLLICLIITIWIGTTAPISAAEDIGSSSAILIDADTGQILYGKNPYTLYSSGNFDKLLNVITALRIEDTPNDLTVSETALSVYTRSPNLGLTAEETVSLMDMLFAVYLEGHNDAANVVAENIGLLFIDTTSDAYQAMTDEEKTQTAIDAFVKQMNITADELCASTMKATNADGHYYDTQQTSCLDVAKLIKNGLKMESFHALFTTKEYTFTGNVNAVDSTAANSTAVNTDIGTEDSSGETNETAGSADEDTAAASGEITLNSSNPLFNGIILYAGIQGGITAFNSYSEKYHCAVYATVNDMNLIAVVMNGTKNGIYDDIQAMLNFGFYKWEKASISPGELSSMLPDDISALNLAFTGSTDFLLPSEYSVSNLEAAVAYTENGYLSGTITLTLPEDASYAGTITTISFYEKNERSVWGKGIKIAGITILVLFILAAVFLFIRFFGARNKAYVKRIHKTAKKEKEKYLKRIKEQGINLNQGKSSSKEKTDSYGIQNKENGTVHNRQRNKKISKQSNAQQKRQNHHRHP
jgi:D-alanyl-D-alanine carboxypeptidase